MKITIVTNEYSVEGGGLSYSCVQYHLLLKDLGHDVSVLSSAYIIAMSFTEDIITDWEKI